MHSADQLIGKHKGNKLSWFFYTLTICHQSITSAVNKYFPQCGVDYFFLPCHISLSNQIGCRVGRPVSMLKLPISHTIIVHGSLTTLITSKHFPFKLERGQQKEQHIYAWNTKCYNLQDMHALTPDIKWEDQAAKWTDEDGWLEDFENKFGDCEVEVFL